MRKVVIVVLTLIASFYVATVIFSVLDWPYADTSWMDCDQPVCPGDDDGG